MTKLYNIMSKEIILSNSFYRNKPIIV